MPVIPNKVSSSLQLKVKTGTDTNGNDIVSSQNYRKVKTEALDANLYNAAQSIASLQSVPLLAVLRIDSLELVNQA